MTAFHIQKGRDIKLKGQANKGAIEKVFPAKAAIQPPDFRGINPKVIVRVGDAVKVGTPIICDRNNPSIVIVSPASGVIDEIKRGDKRALLAIIISVDGKQDCVFLEQFNPNEIKRLKKKRIIAQLTGGGLWPVIRQRPFSKIANPEHTPKAIFIQAINTEPLSLDPDFVLINKSIRFQIGLSVIEKLTEGKVHLCTKADAQSDSLTNMDNIEIHQFLGPHPAGNVSTHIHNIDPINKGDVVWYLHALDVLKIADLFLQGKCFSEQFVAVAGEGVKEPKYIETIVGASMASLLDGQIKEGDFRVISGSVLTGQAVGKGGYLRFYDSQVTVIPSGGTRRFLGWLLEDDKRYSFSKTFLSSFKSKKEVSLDTDLNGGKRAIVLNNAYDSLVPLDILTFFLLRAILSGDIDESEKLGILECDEEDFALCSFVCPSKINIGGIIREGLDLIDQEG